MIMAATVAAAASATPLARSRPIHLMSSGKAA